MRESLRSLLRTHAPHVPHLLAARHHLSIGLFPPSLQVKPEAAGPTSSMSAGLCTTMVPQVSRLRHGKSQTLPDGISARARKWVSHPNPAFAVRVAKHESPPTAFIPAPERTEPHAPFRQSIGMKLHASRKFPLALWAFIVTHLLNWA